MVEICSMDLGACFTRAVGESVNYFYNASMNGVCVGCDLGWRKKRVCCKKEEKMQS